MPMLEYLAMNLLNFALSEIDRTEEATARMTKEATE
jgi:hypothetical protein